MACGLGLGLLVGPSAAGLGELGRVVIQLIKAAAAPLLFLAIVHAVIKTEVGLRAAGRMIAIATVNATIALSIGLMISNVFEAGRHLPASAFAAGAGASAPDARPIDFLKTAAGFVPTSFAQPFVENNIIMLVFLALLVGFGFRRVRGQQEARGERSYQAVEAGVGSLLSVLETVLGWIIRLVPLAVFGVVAKAAGEHGLQPLRGLGAYVLVGLGGLALQALVTYQAWLALYVGLPLKRFWREARVPVVYAAGANSSLATLPVTLRSLERLGVSKESATLGACVGTNLNNDGIILYEAMAVLFVAQAHGIELTLGQQVLAAVSCMVAAAGIAGVPEAGFVSLSLVLATVGLPLELLPLLLTVDWIVARGRSIVNVLSDMLTSIILDRWEGRNFRRAPTH
ncbi:MAG: dicarboxylate/amino acid:cation symporter [Elusimicrobia bacterium]|nr:dicarboxylate/amino acid:cation symporter [Elusimicrobiota bacterium]